MAGSFFLRGVELGVDGFLGVGFGGAGAAGEVFGFGLVVDAAVELPSAVTVFDFGLGLGFGVVPSVAFAFCVTSV
jgi:hypothetical protein